MDIKISVIIPVYNMAKYLQQCLDSVVEQTLKEIEIIAINDGSTDESLEILNSYANNYKNIKIISQENKGAGLARNKGIDTAIGKYIAFIDPDDYYPSNDCLEALYNAANRNGVLMCGGLIMRNQNGIKSLWDKKEIKEFFQNEIINVCNYSEIYGHTRFIYNTDMIKRNNIRYLSGKRFQDQAFVLQALVCAGCFYGIDKVVYEYRTGYKKVSYSHEVCIDTLIGIKDIFQIAKDNNLIKIYENRLKNIHKERMTQFYPFSFCGNEDIDKQIEEINTIVKEWIGKEEDIILTKEKVDNTKRECIEEYKNFIKELESNKKKLFYGAGVRATDFVERYWDTAKNVIGIAVTQKTKSTVKQIKQLSIKQIDEYLSYKGDILIIILTIAEYQEEIEKNLKGLGFNYIMKPNIQRLELGKVLLE